MLIRDATGDDFPAILALNAESVHFLSPLDAARLQHLHAQAAYHRVVEMQRRGRRIPARACAKAPTTTVRTTAGSRSTIRAFLYVDRIVVATARSRVGGSARNCTTTASRSPRTHGSRSLTCEFDLEPPNPASAKFHARYGFREVGRQWLGGGKKQVSLQVARFEA